MIHRRQMLKTLLAASLLPAAAPLVPPPLRLRPRVRPLRSVSDAVDWPAVRDLFPLASDWTHLSSFLFVSHPKPVADAIDHFRRKLDSDAMWIEIAAFTDAEGRPFAAVKRALADYTGGSPTEIAFTSNTTSALAMAYHGLRIRADQEILTTEHDHYSHHESIRYSAARSGASVRYIPLYDSGATANVGQIADRVGRAITAKTRAVGVTWVHSSTGVKLPIDRIAEVVARANRGRVSPDRCLLIVDGVHGFANQDVDARDSAPTSSRAARTSGCSRHAGPGSCGAARMPGPSCDRRFPASIRTASTRRSGRGRIARNCHPRRQRSSRRAGFLPTSTYSPFRRQWSCTAPLDETASQGALQN